MNINMNVKPGQKIEFRRTGSRGRPTVAFVIGQTARSLTVERTTNHEIVKIKPSEIVRLAATGRRLKATKPKIAPKKKDEPAKTARKAVSELTGSGRRKAVNPKITRQKASPTKEVSQAPKKRGRPRKTDQTSS